MIRFQAKLHFASGVNLGKLEASFLQIRALKQKTARASQQTREQVGAALKTIDDRTRGALCKFLPRFEKECVTLGLTSSASQVRRIRRQVEPFSELPSNLDELLRDLLLRLEDEFEAQVFLAVDSSHRAYYENRKAIWGNSTNERFVQAVPDMEEAGRCFAVNRYAACVFHLMRVTEAGVLALGELLELEDHKGHFGSVLGRIEQLIQKTKYDDLPPKAKEHKAMLLEVLPRLYAVKDSWRNKVSHVDGKIIPTGSRYSPEVALDIFNCTVSLMRHLGESFPPAAK